MSKGYEQERAVMEAEMNAAHHAYFEHHKFSIDQTSSRKIFDAGFIRGYEIKNQGITDAQILAAARALANRCAEVCGVDFDDNWNLHGSDFMAEARVAFTAAGLLRMFSQQPKEEANA